MGSRAEIASSLGGYRMSGEGKFIKLADGLEPQSTEKETRRTQSSLLENWTRDDDLARNKTFVLGSQGMVSGDHDKGLFSTVLAAYNNHWVLKTRPEDWWTAISQIIATRIDKHAKKGVGHLSFLSKSWISVQNWTSRLFAKESAVRKFFVSHEGKKQLTVNVGPTIYGVDYDWFFQAMISQITENINTPEYTSLMKADFSQSTSVDRIVNNIMLMYSFKEYFEYRMRMMCGIPGVVMLGSEDDWLRLLEKLVKVEELLKPLEKILQLKDWFKSSQAVLKNLLETYRGNPDKDWWSRIMDIHRTFGSGGGTNFTGWFVADFLGVRYPELEDIPSGINVVPLTITDGETEEESALVAGVTGYTITEEEITDPDSKVTFPSVQSVLGWGLLLEPDSRFK